MNDTKHLIIGGVFKAGTTSLYTYLAEHSAIQKSIKKETGFFVPLRYNQPVRAEEYYANFEKKDFNGWFLESSPGYLFGGKKIAQFIMDNFPQSKMVFILRNPVDRFASFYNMMDKFYWYKIANGDNFPNKLDIQNYYKLSLAHYQSEKFEQDEKIDFILNGLSDGLYANYLKEWYKIFPENQIKIVFFDDLEKNPSTIVKEIAEWLSIDFSELQSIEYKVQNNTKNHKSVYIYRFASYFNHKFESIFRSNPQIKAFFKDIYMNFFTNKNSSYQKSEWEMVLEETEAFYKKPNLELKSFLNQKGIQDLPFWLA